MNFYRSTLFLMSLSAIMMQVYSAVVEVDLYLRLGDGKHKVEGKPITGFNLSELDPSMHKMYCQGGEMQTSNFLKKPNKLEGSGAYGVYEVKENALTETQYVYGVECNAEKDFLVKTDDETEGPITAFLQKDPETNL